MRTHDAVGLDSKRGTGGADVWARVGGIYRCSGGGTKGKVGSMTVVELGVHGIARVHMEIVGEFEF